MVKLLVMLTTSLPLLTLMAPVPLATETEVGFWLPGLVLTMLMVPLLVEVMQVWLVAKITLPAGQS